MANGRIRRALIRVVNDDNLDLYLLGTVALVFTVLGITGVSDVKTTSAAVVALLALLAFSQIRSRRLIEQIGAGARGTTLFSRDFPADLMTRRAEAFDILVVGVSMTRTVQTMRTDMTSILAAGGRVRVLVLDPTDPALMAAADNRIAVRHWSGTTAKRITATLDDLTSLRAVTGGRLEIRVSSVIPSAGLQCLDTASPRGLVCAQYYESVPDGESGPVFTLRPPDGTWYQHFVAEAERLWEAGTDWPFTAASSAQRAPRPVFADQFGPELDTAIDETPDLFITGVARNVIVNTAFGRLSSKLAAGDRVRFLLVDPDSPSIATAASRYHEPRTDDSVRERVLHTLRLLAELKNSTGGDLSVRLTEHPVAAGVIRTDVALFGEYFTYRTRGPAKFVLQSADSGYATFTEEAEKLWESAKPHEW